MKKLWAMLFCAVMLAGCVSTPKEESALPFEIDPVATAEAPWAVGERIPDAMCSAPESRKCYRVFLGVTPDGHKVVQEFYAGDEVFSDPFLIKPTVDWDGIRALGYTVPYVQAVDGRLTYWFPNGAKFAELVKNGDETLEVTMWHENGQVESYVYIKDGVVADAKEWDEQGSLIWEERHEMPSGIVD